jgi:hypothetical protein
VPLAAATSTIARAFASCSDTHAVAPSAEKVAYSGSRTSLTGNSGAPVPASSRPPYTRTSGSTGVVPPASNAWKSAVRTADGAGAATVVGASTRLTVPSGSTE